MSFKKFLLSLNEMARDMGTDLSFLPKQSMIGDKLEKPSKTIEKYKGYFFHVFSDSIIVVNENDIIMGCMLLGNPRFKSPDHIKVVNLVTIDNKLRGKGIGYNLYKIALKYCILIMDQQTSEFAIKIWIKLSNDPGVIVDAIDFTNGTIIEKNIKLKNKSKFIWSEFDFKNDEIYHKGTDKLMDKKLAAHYSRISLCARSK